MALPPLKVKITGDTTGLNRSLKGAGSALKGLAIAAGAASVAVTGALAVMATQGIRLGKEIQNLSRIANATPEAFQRMAAGARTVGVDSEKLSDILKDVNDRVGDFLTTGAGPMADFFEAVAPKVGVTADQFKNLSGPQALQLYVDTLEKAGVNQQQMTFFMEAMASDASKLVPLLRQGGIEMQRFGEAAERSGQIISSEMIDAVARADTALDDISRTFDTLRLRLAAELAPTLEAVVERFNQLAQSEAAQEAVDRLTEAFGKLIEIILSEEFVNVAVSGFETIAGLMSNAAEVAITFSQNLELVTAAFAGLSIAVAALGGPLTIVIGLLAGALVGLATLRQRAESAAGGLSKAEQAEKDLNTALGIFADDASPAAARAARDLATANIDIKKSALEAAKAELVKIAAIAESEFRVGALPGTKDAVDVRMEQRKAQIEQLKTDIEELANLETQLSEAAGIGSVRPRARPMGLGDDPDKDKDLPSIPGVASAGGVASQMGSRLEALNMGLMSERERLVEWYQSGLTLLQEAREAELITEAEYNERKLALQGKFNEEMGTLQDQENRIRLQAIKGALGDASSLMQSENKKLFKIGQAAAIARATVEGWQAAVSSYRYGANIGGPALGAAFAAASLARTGMMISKIASQSPSGSGGGGQSGAVGSGATGGIVNTQQVDINIVGGSDRDRLIASEVVNVLNEAQRDGFRLDPRIIGA